MRDKWLFLFDVDGTLLDAGDLSVNAYRRAFEEILGSSLSIHEVPCAGRTDHNIVTQLLSLYGYAANDALLQEIFRTFNRHIADAVSRGGEASLMPGIPECLDFLSGISAVQLGLLTGNLEGGAMAKLRAAGIERYFPFGAYGSDHADRNELGPIALQRAGLYCDCSFSRENVYIIGDTVHDIACARAAGFRVIAVASGNSSRQDLEKHNPDYCTGYLDPDIFTRILQTA